MIKFADLLVKSSTIMNEYAVKNCNRDYVDTNCSCEWYHSVWQYLRVLNCVSAPQWHESFYINAFTSAFKQKKTLKILISGTADYSLLHLLYTVLLTTENKAEIDIIDKCLTPLYICEWYNEHIDELFAAAGVQTLKNNVTVKTIQKDLLYYNVPDNAKYDIICSDAFLTRFEKDDAVSVVKKWNDLLIGSGKIITTVRIHGKYSPTTLLQLTQKINLFDNKFKGRFKQLKAEQKQLFIVNANGKKEITEEELRFLSYRYIVKMESYSLGNQDDIAGLITSCGFVIDEKLSEINTVEGEISETEYYRIVAEKTNDKR